MPFAELPEEWHQPEIAKKWDMIRNVRRVVTGALELERAEKRIGSSLGSTHGLSLNWMPPTSPRCAPATSPKSASPPISPSSKGQGPRDAFRLDDVKNVAVVPGKAEGYKCARSWKISKDIGRDKDFPDITPRDAEAVREWQTRFGKTLA